MNDSIVLYISYFVNIITNITFMRQCLTYIRYKGQSVSDTVTLKLQIVQTQIKN